MKEDLIELLMSLFEQSLSQLKYDFSDAKNFLDPDLEDGGEEEMRVQLQKPNSMRVITYQEQMKLTKASYQFLMRMETMGLLTPELFETILHKLEFSDSRIVTLQETKWTIRHVLAERLDLDQLTYLDLILYQKENQTTLH